MSGEWTGQWTLDRELELGTLTATVRPDMKDQVTTTLLTTLQHHNFYC